GLRPPGRRGGAGGGLPPDGGRRREEPDQQGQGREGERARGGGAAAAEVHHEGLSLSPDSSVQPLLDMSTRASNEPVTPRAGRPPDPGSRRVGRAGSWRAAPPSPAPLPPPRRWQGPWRSRRRAGPA